MAAAATWLGVRRGLRSLWVGSLLILASGCASDDDGVTEPPPQETDDAGEPSGPPSPELRFERVDLEVDRITETGHRHVTTFAFIPGTDELLLTELHGDVYHYELEDGVGTLLGHFDLSEHVYPSAPEFDWDCGLISIAFDPDFADNGLFYAGLCFDEASTGIMRFSFDPTDYDAIADSAAVIMQEGAEGSLSIHNVGQMGFDDDGYLWALFGDRDLPPQAADVTTNLGALVRIEPDRTADGEGYVPAAGNPYIGDPEGSGDVYAYGFRSPWTGHYDASGRWWIGDVGSSDHWAVEEVNVVTEPEQYFGWPTVEGPCEGECDDLVDPVRHWDHSSSHEYVVEMEDPYPSQSRVGWVGVEYRDRGHDPYDGALLGKLLYGEMCVGFVRAIEVDGTGEVLSDQLVGELPKISAWAQGADGHLYASTYGACEASRDVADIPAGLWRAMPADASDD